MRANRALFVFILSVSTAVSATAASTAKSEVVTNAPPAVSATMTPVGSDGNGCYTWQVSGKVRPEFRGHGATVHLVCARYNELITGQSVALVFPVSRCTEDFCPSNVDDCGNFSFLATSCGAPQLDPSFVCNFVVHVDDAQSPQSCNDPHQGGVTGGNDPNGSAPCTGGMCPGSD